MRYFLLSFTGDKIVLRENEIFFYENMGKRGKVPFEKVKDLFKVRKDHGEFYLSDFSEKAWGLVGGNITPQKKEAFKAFSTMKWAEKPITLVEEEAFEGDGYRQNGGICRRKYTRTFYYDPSGTHKGSFEHNGVWGYLRKPFFLNIQEFCRKEKEHLLYKTIINEILIPLSEPLKKEKSYWEKFQDEVGRIKVTYEGVEHTLGVTFYSGELCVTLHRTRNKGWSQRTHTPAKSFPLKFFREEYLENLDIWDWENLVKDSQNLMQKAAKELQKPRLPKPRLKKKR